MSPLHVDHASGLTAFLVRIPDGPVAFQGCVLPSGDLLATWTVELAVHHLDLTRDAHFGPPSPDSLSLGRATVEDPAEAAFPRSVSDTDCLLIGAGRLDPSEAGQALAAAMPVLG